jgi:hypothetical protein
VNSEINAGSSNNTTVLQDGDGLQNAEVNNLADTAVNSEINAAATNETIVIQGGGGSL